MSLTCDALTHHFTRGRVSGGCAGLERAGLLQYPLHGSGNDAKRLADFQHARAPLWRRRIRFSISALLIPQRFSSSLRAPSLRLPRPSFTPCALARFRPAFTRPDDHRALELGEHAAHLEHGAPRWRAGIERLLGDLLAELRRFSTPVLAALPLPEGANGRWNPDRGAWE